MEHTDSTEIGKKFIWGFGPRLIRENHEENTNESLQGARFSIERGRRTHGSNSKGSSVVAVGQRSRDQRGLSPPVFAPGKHPLRWVLLSVVERNR
ncbi:unnamed protein product [Lactuca virosa]|uniref:Uncharacterized protein n=1 Tax=Lactuca virosa TaxID=75947 RepID=A0AAU9LT56_9ASTR|nr:unnamed protein product [Lactuca virosa]